MTPKIQDQEGHVRTSLCETLPLSESCYRILLFFHELIKFFMYNKTLFKTDLVTLTVLQFSIGRVMQDVPI